MNLRVNERLKSHVQKLIAEGNAVKATKFCRSQPGYVDMGDPYVDGEAFLKWLTSCRNLVFKIGPSAKAWIDVFDSNFHNYLGAANTVHGALRSLEDAIDNDLLAPVENLVMADAFGSLLEQARELLSKGYALAAGVLCRAVLEEHLRKLCDRIGCLPAGKPTINDLNMALYKNSRLDKLEMQNVTALATAGNHCAHNDQPPLSSPAVQKFLDDVGDFLVRHALP